MIKRAGNLLSPDEKIVKFDCISDFARLNNLSIHHVSQVLNGQRVTYRGWQVPVGYIKIKNPYGQIKKFQSYYKFTQDNNLGLTALIQVIKGSLYHHKGWVLPENDNIEIKTKTPRIYPEYKVIAPDGKIYAIKNISKFCRENNLERTGISKVLNGKLKEINGWKIK